MADHGELLQVRLIGGSAAMEVVRQRIRQIASYDVTVTIYGETGTGKELVARALHYSSRQADGPFVPVNCGAFPDQLIESDLFGHKRGAFTDARQDRRGLIEQAEGGTLFLDEIDALSPQAQVILLRFLQDRQYRPVGGEALRNSNVRVIVASNVRLGDMQLDQNRFRPDLYYRLNVLTIDLPPLRARGDDLLVLARHFLEKFRVQHALGKRVLTPAALDWIASRSWPGNVRELENAINRGVLLASGPAVQPVHLDPAGLSPATRRSPRLTDLSFGAAKARVVADFEKEYLRNILAQCGGNVTEAAARAKTERRTIGRLLKKHGIERRATQVA